MSRPHRTDSRTLAERKRSVTMRRVELEGQLREVVAAEAEIDREIEESERAREKTCDCRGCDCCEFSKTECYQCQVARELAQ